MQLTNRRKISGMLAWALVASVATGAHAQVDPCELISKEQRDALGLIGWHSSAVPANLDAKPFGLDNELKGRSCEFRRGRNDMLNVLSIFDIPDERARFSLFNHLQARTQDAALHNAASAGQVVIRTQTGICEAIYLGESQLSICTSLLPGAFVMLSLGERNGVGKAFPPLKLMQLLNDVSVRWPKGPETGQ